jgi:hypothetical protein
MEVRREDQEKINKFSSLHQKETNLEEELRAKIVSAATPCFALPIAFHLAHCVSQHAIDRSHSLPRIECCFH